MPLFHETDQPPGLGELLKVTVEVSIASLNVTTISVSTSREVVPLVGFVSVTYGDETSVVSKVKGFTISLGLRSFPAKSSAPVT